MDELIYVINRLQDVLLSIGAGPAASSVIDLPQIAVVGAQSVGKSSVLEALVGRDFLPRGIGVVTRRPLILQLRNLKSQPSQGSSSSQQGGQGGGGQGDSSPPPLPEEYGEFLHCPSRRFTEFDKIREEIERETERVSGKHKNISASPIVLKIFSPYVIDLTLVDLPGITKVPVGDQPSDIEMQIRRIVFQFISKPTTIILAVTAANTDIANSDSLKIAREVDPEGVRTLGVVTKVDTLEEGTDCADLLRNKIIPLKRGYIGVVCRGQRHTAEGTTIREALKEEESFFRNHPAYKAIAHKQGIPYLAKSLNQILMNHIREVLPELKSRISHLLQKTEAELATYGDPLLEAKANPGALLLHFFSRFARNFQDAIDGKLQAQHSSEQLMGGARINFIFHDWYSRALAEFDPLDGLSDHEIRTAIRNATGPKAALFVPEGAFEILVKKQIQQLEMPSLQCVEQVYEELQKIVEKCELPEMSRFGNLRDRVMDVVRGVLRRCLAPTNQMIHNIIQIELAYINTNHPDFMNNRFGGSGAGGGSSSSSYLQNHYGDEAGGHRGAGGGLSYSNQYLSNSSQPSRYNNNSSHPSNANRLIVGSSRESSHRSASAYSRHSSGGNRSNHRIPPSLLSLDGNLSNSNSSSSSGGGGGHPATPQTHPVVVPPASPLLSTPSPLPPQAQQIAAAAVAANHHHRATSDADQQQGTGGGGGVLQQHGGFFSFLKSARPGSSSSSSSSSSTAAAGGASNNSASTSSSRPPASHNVSPGMSSRPSPGSPRSSSADDSSRQPSSTSPLYPQPRSHTLDYSDESHHLGRSSLRSSFGGTSGGTYEKFRGGGGVGIRLPQVPSIVAPSEVPSEREQIETDLIKSLIWSYFQIVRKNVADAVPKSIMYFMVNTAKDVLQRELVAQLYREELFSDLMREADDICERRSQCKQLLRSLRGASDILAQIRDFNFD